MSHHRCEEARQQFVQQPWGHPTRRRKTISDRHRPKWGDLPQNKVLWWTSVNMVMNLWIP
jgi:hypothetical protein